MQVEFEWNVFIFFFHLKIFSSLLIKSNHQRCSIEKAVLKKSKTFTGKHLHLSQFLIKFQVWRPATLLKRESNTDVFLWIMGILKNTYFEENLRTMTSVDNFKTFHLQCFDFMTNTVCIISIMLIIMLSVKFKVKICLLRQL